MPLLGIVFDAKIRACKYKCLSVRICFMTFQLKRFLPSPSGSATPEDVFAAPVPRVA